MQTVIRSSQYMIKCCDYLIKMIQFQTKDANQVVSERLRQISLLE